MSEHDAYTELAIAATRYLATLGKGHIEIRFELYGNDGGVRHIRREFRADCSPGREYDDRRRSEERAAYEREHAPPKKLGGKIP